MKPLRRPQRLSSGSRFAVAPGYLELADWLCSSESGNHRPKAWMLLTRFTRFRGFCSRTLWVLTGSQ
jgi:hypothetical protein